MSTKLTHWACPKCGGKDAVIHQPETRIYDVLGIHEDGTLVVSMSSGEGADGSGDTMLVCQARGCDYVDACGRWEWDEEMEGPIEVAS